MLMVTTKAELLEMLSEVPNEAPLYIQIAVRSIGRALDGRAIDDDVTLSLDGPIIAWPNNLGFSIVAGYTHTADSILINETSQ